MIIEYLYPEIANLYGDHANFKYLKQSIPEAEFKETPLNSVPAFVSANVSLIYMGPMTEAHQLLALAHLLPYRDRLLELIENGTHFLMTGNSFELFGRYIESNGTKTECLNILDFYSRTDTSHRYNGFFLGEYNGSKITAFNSRFSNSYPGENCSGFFKVLRGQGLNSECPFEGISKNNFVGTYLLGPLLVLNPQYTAELIKKLGSNGSPAFFADSMAAYNRRLCEFEDSKRKLD